MAVGRRSLMMPHLKGVNAKSLATREAAAAQFLISDYFSPISHLERFVDLGPLSALRIKPLFHDTPLA